MNESELKTSPRQRILIGLIAVIMLGSVIASYLAVIISNSKSNSSSSQGISSAKITEYEIAYGDKKNEFKEATASEYETFSKYLSEIKAYNEASVNADKNIETKTSIALVFFFIFPFSPFSLSYILSK